MRRFLGLVSLGAALLLVGTRPATGQPDFLPAKKPATKTNLPAGIEPAQTDTVVNPFPLTPNAGDWMICAAHYTGPDGMTLARQVALELRNRHRMPAYIFNRGEEERKKQREHWEQMAKQYPGANFKRRGVRIPDQYAVLIGGYKDMNAAHAGLAKVRKLPLPKLTLEGGKSPYDIMSIPEPPRKKGEQPGVKRVPVNPFHNAMVVRNPQVAHQQVNKPKWDPLWKKLNENEEYNLLKNPKPWTLLVKEYMAGRVVQPQKAAATTGSKIRDFFMGSPGGESLAGAAMQAHELARFLRTPQMGFTAYVLHTRHSSIVTVGGFDGPNDPELQRLQRQLSMMKFSAQQGQSDPIGLLPNPVPVEVPRP